jgi:hypothetical protein
MPSKVKSKAAKRPSRVVNGRPAAGQTHGDGRQRRAIHRNQEQEFLGGR